jgi:hypothetical protein
VTKANNLNTPFTILNFDQLSQYTEKADGVIFQTAV